MINQSIILSLSALSDEVTVAMACIENDSCVPFIFYVHLIAQVAQVKQKN